MTKVRRFLGIETLISMYFSLIYPYLTYGCILWGNNYENPLCDVVRLQNKVARIINDVPIQDHITQQYINLHLLKFPDVGKLHTCLFLYDHIHDKKSSKFLFSF